MTIEEVVAFVEALKREVESPTSVLSSILDNGTRTLLRKAFTDAAEKVAFDRAAQAEREIVRQ